MVNNASPILSLVAHRGEQQGAVENTRQAFELAAKAGARFIECDIQCTKDLQPVVIHDDDLSRLCHHQGFVSEMVYNELERFCLPSFKLLSLSRLMLWLKKKPQLKLFLEIKSDALSRMSEKEVAGLIDDAVPEGVRSQIIIISYSAAILQACSKLLDCPLGWVTDKPLTVPETIKTKLNYVFTDAKQAEHIHPWKEQGMQVGVYTVNQSTEIPQLIAKGVDLIETNHFTSMVTALSDKT